MASNLDAVLTDQKIFVDKIFTEHAELGECHGTDCSLRTASAAAALVGLRNGVNAFIDAESQLSPPCSSPNVLDHSTAALQYHADLRTPIRTSLTQDFVVRRAYDPYTPEFCDDIARIVEEEYKGHIVRVQSGVATLYNADEKS